MKYKQSFRITLALLSLLVAAVAASTAQATSHPGYAYGTDDKTPAHDKDGHCVRTTEWRKEYATTECNPELLPAPKVAAPAPAPAPAPVPPPVPVPEPTPAPAAIIDSDGDGVPDSLDKCPDTPKGVKVDTNGCPLDSDGDGVADYLDKCPDTPKGTPVDKDGCPLPKKVSIALEIEFDSGKAVIKPQYQDQIKKVADFMTTYPAVTAEIEGHTDNVGKESSNMNLSKRRAESVRIYLIDKFGIAPGRLSAKGFGSSQPVADNKTPEGRQKNRRINAAIETMTK